MVRRCVDAVELHRLVTNVDDAVPSPLRNDDCPVGGDLLGEGHLVLGRAHLDAAAAGLEAQELVLLGVHLETDVAANRDVHHGDLELLAGPDGGAEGLVIEGCLLDIDDETLRSLISCLCHEFSSFLLVRLSDSHYRENSATGSGLRCGAEVRAAASTPAGHGRGKDRKSTR